MRKKIARSSHKFNIQNYPFIKDGVIHLGSPLCHTKIIYDIPNIRLLYETLKKEQQIVKQRIKERQNIYLEELIKKTCHPSRIMQIGL